jgi:hypothetical protein
MAVSVLSGLARADVDPWQEAAKLAQLPGETATQRLASLIAALPDRVSAYPDARTIATRLIALLPRQRVRSGGSPPQSLHEVMNSRPWWVYVVLMSFVLGSQFLIASHQLPPKAGDVDVTASNIASPQVPPQNYLSR